MPVPPSLDLLLNIFNCIFCPVQLQMVIHVFAFKEEGTGTEQVAICTIWYISLGATSLPRFNGIALLLAEIFKFFYYANLVTDVIGCASTVV